MSVGDIYQVRIVADFGVRLNVVNNIFYYRCTTAAGSAEDLSDIFDSEVLAAIQAIQTAFIKWRLIEVKNLFQVADFFNTTFDTDDRIGLQSGETLPAHDAMSFRYVRSNRDVRNGYKRFCGVPEGVQSAGFIGDATFLTTVNATRNTLKSVLTGTIDAGSYQPIILKRIKHNPDSEHSKDWYTLPQTVEEAEYGEVADVLFNQFVSHQVTRES